MRPSTTIGRGHDLCLLEQVIWLRFANALPAGHAKEKPIRSASRRFDVHHSQARFCGRRNIYSTSKRQRSRMLG